MKFVVESKTYGNREVIIDPEDAAVVLSRSWCVSKKGECFYVMDRKNNIYLHRLLMGAHVGKVIDHINGNSLDNRKVNLRECTHKENIRNRRGKNKNNTSGFKGVFWAEYTKRWRAQIKVDRKTKFLGYYKNALDAAKAYDAAALKFHGVFASLNGVL